MEPRRLSLVRPLVKRTILSFCIALLVASACSSNEKTNSTLPEEATTTLLDVSLTEEQERIPLPDPAWDDVALQAIEIATVESPTAITHQVSDPNLWVSQRSGIVHVILHETFFDKRRNATEYFSLRPSAALDISSKVAVSETGGLAGIAVSNDGQQLYVSYTSVDNKMIVASYELFGFDADPRSERLLIEIEQPVGESFAGPIHIGPDGFLYIAVPDVEKSSAQDSSTYAGSILRIDPQIADDENNYVVPAGNPTLANNGKQEVWLTGVRRPSGFSFDSQTDDIWLTDSGNTQKEIYLLSAEHKPAGRADNLGWPLNEGTNDFVGEPPANYQRPFLAYETQTDDQTCGPIGGHRYRGDDLEFRANGLVDAPFKELYFFADTCSGELFALEQFNDRGLVKPLVVENLPPQIQSLGRDNTEELYVAGGNGQIVRIDLAESKRETVIVPQGQPFPRKQLPLDQQILPGVEQPTSTQLKEAS